MRRSKCINMMHGPGLASENTPLRPSLRGREGGIMPTMRRISGAEWGRAAAAVARVQGGAMNSWGGAKRAGVHDLVGGNDLVLMHLLLI